MNEKSATPLYKKLEIKDKCRLYVKNPPDNYETLISQKPFGIKILKRLSKEIDIIHFFTDNRNELITNIEQLTKKIEKNGMIWISWPKKASGITSDITEDVLREIILPLGLVDTKVCSLDHVWSGLKFVFRKEKR